MSSSNMSTADVDGINYGSNIFYQFWCYLLISFGTVGHLLNIYVFTRPALRSNPCVRYFLVSTLSGILVTYINIPLRLMQLVYNIDVFAYSDASCKILSYILFWARAQTPWFTALASVDRFLCSSRSVALRSWSNVRVTSRTILIVILIVGVGYIHSAIKFERDPKFHKCAGYNDPTYILFHGLWSLVMFSPGPSVVMLIFGSLTIRHVQQSVKRTMPHNIHSQIIAELPSQAPVKRQKMIDRQLIQMMVVQCVYFTLTSTPVSVFWIYTAARINIVPDALQRAKNTLFSSSSGFISLTSACTSFYLFTLSSELFRRELVHLFDRRWRPNQKAAINEIPLARRS